MKIKGEIHGDMIFHGAKLYGETKTRMAKVTLAIKVEEDQAKDKFGADFHRVAFGAMTVKDGVASFPYSTLQGPNLKLEPHDMELFGTKCRIFPELPRIAAVDDGPAVVLSLVIPLEAGTDRKSFFGELTCASGDCVRAVFEPVQIDIEDEINKKSGMQVKRKDGRFGNKQPVLVEG